MNVEDKNAPNLFIGKEIGNDSFKGKVESFDDNQIKIKIIVVNDKNETLPKSLLLKKDFIMVKQHNLSLEKRILLWESSSNSLRHLKNNISQMFLQFEKNVGWSWDIISCSIDYKGNKFWKNSKNQRHRVNGPAYEWADGKKEYYQYDEYHREDGPAVNDGTTEYYFYHGKQIKCSSLEEFKQLLKLKYFW